MLSDLRVRSSKSKASSSSRRCDRELLSAMKGEIRAIATAAMALAWKRRFMNQHSKIVSRQSSLQDPHHENYEKHRYVLARDLFDCGWLVRLRLKSWAGHFSALSNRAGCGHFHSDGEIDAVLQSLSRN